MQTQINNSWTGALLPVAAAALATSAYVYNQYVRRDSTNSSVTGSTQIGDDSFKIMQYNNVPSALSDKEKK